MIEKRPLSRISIKIIEPTRRVAFGKKDSFEYFSKNAKISTDELIILVGIGMMNYYFDKNIKDLSIEEYRSVKKLLKTIKTKVFTEYRQDSVNYAQDKMKEFISVSDHHYKLDFMIAGCELICDTPKEVIPLIASDRHLLQDTIHWYTDYSMRNKKEFKRWRDVQLLVMNFRKFLDGENKSEWLTPETFMNQVRIKLGDGIDYLSAEYRKGLEDLSKKGEIELNLLKDEFTNHKIFRKQYSKRLMKLYKRGIISRKDWLGNIGFKR